MTAPPYENTLTTNSTHRQLMDLGSSVSGTVTSPARVEEQDKGYDVKHEYGTLKRVEYQYKRMSSGPFKRDIADRRKEEWISFEINTQQIKTLLSRTLAQNISFITLPVIEYDAHLSQILERTVFIDVLGFERMALGAREIDIDNFSRLYVSKSELEAGKKTPAVFAKDKETSYSKTSRAYYEIPSVFVKRWSEVKNSLTCCPLGMKIQERGDLTPIFKDYRQHMADTLEFVTGENNNIQADNLLDKLFEYRSKYIDEEFSEHIEHANNNYPSKHPLREELAKTLKEVTQVNNLSDDYQVDFHYELSEELDDTDA